MAVYTAAASCCFLGQFVVWFCLRPVQSIWFTLALAAATSVVLNMQIYACLIEPSSVFVFPCI